MKNEPDWRKVFNEQFQPIQQELAALVSALEVRRNSWENMGKHIAAIDANLNALIKFMIDVGSDGEMDRLLSIVNKIAGKHLPDMPPVKPTTPAKVLPFTSANKKKPTKKK